MFLIKRTGNALDLSLPARQSPEAAGFDLYANVKNSIEIKKGERVLVPTGIMLALPFGYEAQIRPRSGLALRHGVTVLNTPGTVDSDYRGELCVLLINMGNENFTICRGDRIAQMIIAKVEMIKFIETTEPLPDSQRGSRGYGSTGGMGVETDQ